MLCKPGWAAGILFFANIIDFQLRNVLRHCFLPGGLEILIDFISRRSLVRLFLLLGTPMRVWDGIL